MKKTKNKQTNHAPTRLSKPQNPKLPFIEHVYELRKRLFYVAISVGLWAAGAYCIQQRIVTILLKPAAGQQFIYTSVGGGIDFLFRVCIYAGIVFSIPIIVFQVLRYLEPLIKRDAIRFMTLGSAASGVLAVGGMVFGYFIGLPAALHFLLHQFTTDKIHPLLTIQSYMSFVTLYMLGAALLFQLPLLMILINRIKPLKPKKLLSMERWVILVAFVLGGIMNPSPRIQDQILLAGPMIITYQIGIFIIWLSNRRTQRPASVISLREKDEQARAERLAKFRLARELRQSALPAVPITPVNAPQYTPVPMAPDVPTARPVVASVQSQPTPAVSKRMQRRATPLPTVVRRGHYFNDFTVPRRFPAPPLRPPIQDQLNTET
ncbi:MAG TPA: twin-arginine translocase subunit TatC [Candidatus Saccharimonadales bacterium]|jgi:sec-independent protein translocase protein TatC|nr:twin-arginine translocase subunit TatC [Candidatus Saccharimonadales bacterium]